MSRKTILKLTTILSCSVLALSLSSCKDSESEQASKDARESINKGNRLIKSGSEQVNLTPEELEKIKSISGDLAGEQLRLERQRLAQQISQRLAAAADDSVFAEINAEIEALAASEINTQDDFNDVCTQLIEITNKIVMLAEKSTGKEQKEMRSQAALAELAKAQAALRNAPDEDGRRQTLNSASALSLATIYASKARSGHEQLILQDLNVHSILMAINSQVHLVRQANNDILAAREAKPEKAIAELTIQLNEAKDTLADIYTRLNNSKSVYSEYQVKYQENTERANHYRDKYLKALSDADRAQGAQKYQLEMEATLQRVGKENMQKWASKWLADGGDSELKLFVNSSKEIVGGIHFENQAELARLQMESIDNQTKIYNGMVEKTQNRIAQLQVYIDKLKNAPETTSEIERRINAGEQAKNDALAKIKTLLGQLASFEAGHTDMVNLAADLYQQAVLNMEQYVSAGRAFGEFDPENFKRLINADMARLYENNASFYNSAISSIENLRRLPEMAEDSLDIIEDYQEKAASSAQTAGEVKALSIIPVIEEEQIASEPETFEEPGADMGQEDDMAEDLTQTMEEELYDAIDELNGEPNDAL
ncbi:MAG: hypothetical protein JXM68_01475 [Sedimentisphaerales bacterium]|nr:hypothetical protein [Sedimentisphaerales bacterium]